MNRYLQAKLVKYQHLYIIETTASIPTKLSTDKHQQIHFVHGPNTHTTNPRWQTAAILKKEKSPYLSKSLINCHKLLQDDTL